jgi:hypothetical protein
MPDTCGVTRRPRRSKPSSVASWPNCFVQQSKVVVSARASHTDIDLTFWALRGVIETTHGVTNTAWRWHLAILIAGMRLGADELGEAPLNEELAGPQDPISGPLTSSLRLGVGRLAVGPEARERRGPWDIRLAWDARCDVSLSRCGVGGLGG